MPESPLCEVCTTCPPACACPHFGQNATPVPTSPPHLLQKAIGSLHLRIAKEGKNHHEAEGYHCCPQHTSGAVAGGRALQFIQVCLHTSAASGRVALLEKGARSYKTAWVTNCIATRVVVNYIAYLRQVSSRGVGPPQWPPRSFALQWKYG